MYCPNCGKSNPANQRFFPACGLSLQATSDALAKELAGSSDPDSIAVKLVEVPSQKVGALDFRGWQNPLIYAFLLIVIGLVINVAGGKAFDDKTAADIGGLIAVLGVGLLGLKGLVMVGVTTKAQLQQGSPPRAERTTQLPRVLVSGVPASITENTTRQLDTRAEAARLEVGRVEGARLEVDPGAETPSQIPRDTQPTLSR
jgi:hypothetical protein